jgi:AraC-like DNA-binding protein
MNTCLLNIENWLELAKKSQWKVLALAKECKRSVRTLEIFFQKHFKKSPKRWMIEERQRQAIQRLNAGNTVKQTAFDLCYKHPSHLTNDVKMHRVSMSNAIQKRK